MAAPAVVARLTPTGFKLPDGYQTTIALGANPGLQFWEKTVKPAGIDGGEGINTTTMLNARWRTFQPKSLITMAPCSVTVAYDPNVIAEIFAIINFITNVTIHFPDHATLTMWAWIAKFDFQELKEGEMPEANVDITPSNFDPINLVESGPVYTPAGGTT